MPHIFSIAYTTGTEYRIDLEPVCKFEFVCCLKVYKKNGPIRTMKGPWMALLVKESSEISLAGSIFGSILRSMKVQEGPLSLGRDQQLPKKCSNMVKVVTECLLCRNIKPSLKMARKFRSPYQGPVGSIEGPWLVLDRMRVHLCVPRVP